MGGSLKNKQNCFDDFQAAACWLHGNGISNPSTLGIVGGSNGGLLVAACANQAPELFGCVICMVGVLDVASTNSRLAMPGVQTLGIPISRRISMSSCSTRR